MSIRMFALLSASMLIGCAKSDVPIAESGDVADKVTTGIAASDATVTTPPSNAIASAADHDEAGAKPQTSEPGKLDIGDAAPQIAVAKWVKGEPMDGLTPGTVNVVEFWATWCGPCLQNMPHISSLQEEYGDQINVIGFTREELDTVTEFLAKEQSGGKTWDEVLKYRIAIDDGSQTNRAYMKAAGQRGIPCAFIVGKEGVVEWIGHPAGMDDALASIVDGTWDRQAALLERQEQQKFSQVMSSIGQEINDLMAAKDYDGALAAIDGVVADYPQMANRFSMARLGILEDAGRREEMAELQSEIVENTNNPSTLNGIAWQIATDPDGGDLDLALRAARQAAELTKFEYGPILDTLARVYYEQGDLNSAVEWQEKAVEFGQGHKSISKTLAKYQEELAEAEDADASSDE